MKKNNSQALFAGQEEMVNIGGANQLTKTAQLTNVSTQIAHTIIQTVIDDQATYSAKVVASQQSHDEMDKLIEELGNLSTVDVEFLKVESDEILDKMLKSQQSKRSRSKSKTMTQDNYTNMMTAAIAEHLLRTASGKPKGASYGGNGVGDATYSEEELEKLANDPDALTRAIRNVQSKKSIAKSKADFDVESERWSQLLTAEKQLKDLRGSISGVVDKATKEAVDAKHAVEELLADKDMSTLSAEEALELLAKTKEMLAGR